MTTENKQGEVIQRQYKRVSEVLRHPDFHEDAIRVKLEAVEGKQVILWDAQFRDWSSEYGNEGFYLLYASYEAAPGDYFTFIAGKKALMDKVRKLIAKRAFPVVAEFRQIISKDFQPYWDMQ